MSSVTNVFKVKGDRNYLVLDSIKMSQKIPFEDQILILFTFHKEVNFRLLVCFGRSEQKYLKPLKPYKPKLMVVILYNLTLNSVHQVPFENS